MIFSLKSLLVAVLLSLTQATQRKCLSRYGGYGDPSPSAPLSPSPPAVASASDYLSFLVIGDWGEPSNVEKEKGNAIAMNVIAKKNGASFVIGVGDNFYSAGVDNEADTKFKEVWDDVYNGDAIRDLPWYVVMGNHDWYGNSRAQLEYAKINSRWIMPDFFYTKVFKAGAKQVAIVFIDTDLFHYGYGGTGDLKYPGNRLLPNFEAQGWTEKEQTLEKQLAWVEEQLKMHSSTANYIFVAGHHDLVTCSNNATGMLRLKTIMENYKVSAYLFGHRHALGSAKLNNVMYVQSGAGGQTEAACTSPPGVTSFWTKGNIFGFASIAINGSSFAVDYIQNDGSHLYSAIGPARF